MVTNACSIYSCVKVASVFGNTSMIQTARRSARTFAGGKPTRFICGNDAKRAVTQILDQFGWETEDMGAEAAHATKPTGRRPFIFNPKRWA